MSADSELEEQDEKRRELIPNAFTGLDDLDLLVGEPHEQIESRIQLYCPTHEIRLNLPEPPPFEAVGVVALR